MGQALSKWDEDISRVVALIILISLSRQSVLSSAQMLNEGLRDRGRTCRLCKVLSVVSEVSLERRLGGDRIEFHVLLIGFW
jgi:hypothetical protein